LDLNKLWALWPEALGLWDANLVAVTFVFCARKRKSNQENGECQELEISM
jgi:hypothetical protein